MASYSSFPVSNDELDMLLLASPMLSSSQQHHQLSSLQVPPVLEPFHLEQAPIQAPLRRRSNSTMAMLLGTDNDELRCRYPSKLCANTRVRKASGALHRYCAYHRDKANANQKRWVDRQRNEGAGSPTSSAAFPSAVTSPSFSFAQTKYRWIMAAAAKRDEAKDNDARSEDTTRASADAATLSDEDWNSLLSLLAPPPATSQSTSRSSGSRCEHRRRAASSPMLPTFATKGAH